MRFIPTPVGNTYEMFQGCNGETVHPHACGEHNSSAVFQNPQIGSSPRLWGTHHLATERRLRYRFIPTPVGNTPLTGIPPDRKPVHPHACGEHIEVQVNGQFLFGSSPRLWGTRIRKELTT